MRIDEKKPNILSCGTCKYHATTRIYLVLMKNLFVSAEKNEKETINK